MSPDHPWYWYLVVVTVRYLMHEVIPWLVREAIVLNLATCAAVFAGVAAFYQWGANTDWERMVNRIFPKKKS